MTKLTHSSHKNLILMVVVGILIGLATASYKPYFSRYSSGKQLSINVTSSQETDSLYSIEAEYPQVKSASQNFNQQIANSVQKNISDFKQNTAANWQARQATTDDAPPVLAPGLPPYYFYTGWQPYQMNQQFVSFVVRTSAFDGGANANQTLDTYNFDLKKQQQVELADVLPNQDNLLEKISVISRQQLSGTLSSDGGTVDSQMLNDGTQPTEENFTNFVFDNSNVIILFPKYQVAPGVFGEQQVVISRDQTQFEQMYQQSVAN